MENKHIAAAMAAVMEEFNHFDETLADGFWHDICDGLIDRLRFPGDYETELTAKKAGEYLFKIMERAYNQGAADCDHEWRRKLNQDN